jgi:hypothetical protein
MLTFGGARSKQEPLPRTPLALQELSRQHRQRVGVRFRVGIETPDSFQPEIRCISRSQAESAASRFCRPIFARARIAHCFDD